MSMQTLMMEHDPGQFHSLSAILSSCRGPSDGFDMDAHHHILHKGPGMPEPSNQQVLMTQRILTSLSMVPHVGLVLMRRVSLFLLRMDVWWLSLRMVPHAGWMVSSIPIMQHTRTSLNMVPHVGLVLGKEVACSLCR